MSVSINGTNGITFYDASTQNTAATGFGFKNRIINGAMVIDQRNAGASVTPTNGAYTLDRYVITATQASKISVQQNAGAVTPPVGFTNYLGVISLSAYSVVAADVFRVLQFIEGFNTADLSFGSANASAVTLSFWVRSSLTGTFGGALQNGSAPLRSYPFTYTINAANTWEQKSVTISGDTSGTWLTTNGIGIRVEFGLGVGSTYSGTAGSWSSSDFTSATGATSVVGTSGATFYITGVQLEKGSTATSFDYRPYSTELALCQRYYWQRNSETSYAAIGSGVMYTASTGRVSIQYPVPMRAVPTVSATSLSSMLVTQGTDLTPNSFTPYSNSTGAMVDMNTTVAGTIGRGVVLCFANLSTGSVQASAEL
jgi:hypothetical protein